MPVTIKNLPLISSATEWTPELGARIVEAFRSLQQAHDNVEQQTNANSTGQPQSPPTLDGLQVTGQNGHFSIAIQHDRPIYRDIRYFAEHADNPNFSQPHVIDMGASRNHTVFLGNVTRYWRAYSSYGSSGPSEPVYHGTSTRPRAVTGGGTIGGPAFTTAQGSGTGAAGVGLQGQGQQPFRPVDGKPPAR